MSSSGEYYGVEKFGDEWVAMYDIEQHLMGKRFATKEEALHFVEMNIATPPPLESFNYENCKKFIAARTKREEKIMQRAIASQRAEDHKRIVEEVSKPFGLTRRQVLTIIDKIYGGENEGEK